MKLSKEVLELMGKPVKYCRAKINDEGKHDLFKGNGKIVGIIVGASRRVQIMVKDDESDKNQAFTLDELCVDPTDADADAYFAHHTKLKVIVEEHNQAQRQREQDKIKEVDDLNAEMFGQPLEI